jgi:hypothetical protein
LVLSKIREVKSGNGQLSLMQNMMAREPALRFLADRPSGFTSGAGFVLVLL